MPQPGKTPIILYNTATAAAVPAAANLNQGELAVNVTDSKVYTKDSGGLVKQIVGTLGAQDANAVAITGGTMSAVPISAAPSVAFDTVAPGAGGVGTMVWNATDGTVDLGLLGGNVTLQVGQEELVRIFNNSGAAMTDMQVVRITGSQGNNLTASLAQANTEANSATSLAVVTEPIANNNSGFATRGGLVNQVNTSAFLQGDALWLSPTVAGGITNVKPTAPNHLVLVGWCVRSHATVGSIFVHIQNGYELNELHDVLITTPVGGQSLIYDAATPAWKNVTAPEHITVTGTDTIVGTATPAISAYAVGQRFSFVAAGANATTAVTLNIGALGAKAITKLGATALAVGDIPLGAVVEVVYDGTQFQLTNLVASHAALADQATNATNAATATNALSLGGALANTYAPLASPALTGVPTAPTAVAGDNTTQLATTAFVTAADALKAPIASPTFTGVPAAPTPAVGTNTTQLATTAFVMSSIGTAWQAYTQSQGVTYTNVWGKTIFIYLRWSSGVLSGGYYAQVVVNGLEVYLQSGGAWSIYHSACIPVPPGGTWYWTQNGNQAINVNSICI